MSAERAVQAAIYSALTSDSALMSLITGVFDGMAPQGTAYPYTVLGMMTERDASDLGGEGWNLTITIHDWSDYGGKKECQQIREARNDVLHKKTLTVAGFGKVTLWQEFAEIFPDGPDPDNTIYHGVSRYRALAWDGS